MGYLDPRLSRLLAEQRVAEARRHARPERRSGLLPDGTHLTNRLKIRLGRWMVITGERLITRDVEVA